MILALINQSNKDARQRTERLEDQMNRGFEQLRSEMNHQADGLRAEMNRGFEQLRAEMNRRFDEQDVRIRGLEQGQAYMSGQFSELKDHLTHPNASGSGPESAD